MKFHVDGVAQGKTTVFAFVRMRRPGNIIEFAHNVIPSAEPAWMLTLGLTLSPEHEGALSRRTMPEPHPGERFRIASSVVSKRGHLSNRKPQLESEHRQYLFAITAGDHKGGCGRGNIWQVWRRFRETAGC